MEILVAVLVVAFIIWLIKRQRPSAAAPPPELTEDPVAQRRPMPPAEPEQPTRDSVWITPAEAESLLGHLSPGNELPLSIENGPGGRLPTSPEGKYFAPGNRQLTRLGVHWLNVRGASHYQDERARVMIRPGDRVILHREPENEYDPNAVAVQREGLTLGYINKGLAKRLAKRLDSGEAIQAVALRLEPLSILVSTPEQLSQLDL